MSRVILPLKALGEIPVLASLSFWWLPAFLGLWLHHSSFQHHHLQISLFCLHITFCSVSVYQLFLCLSPRRTLWSYLGSTPIIQSNLPISKLLISSHLQRFFFQIRSHLQALRIRSRSLWGPLSRPLHLWFVPWRLQFCRVLLYYAVVVSCWPTPLTSTAQMVSLCQKLFLMYIDAVSYTHLTLPTTPYV